MAQNKDGSHQDSAYTACIKYRKKNRRHWYVVMVSRSGWEEKGGPRGSGDVECEQHLASCRLERGLAVNVLL